MNQDPYQSFKKGIKDDVKNAAMGFYLISGLALLGIVLFSILLNAIKSKTMDSSLRLWLIVGVVVIALLMILSKSLRTRIMQGWLILLIGIPICFVLFIVGYLLYTVIANPL
ncbi:hypothetical protein INP83_05060 [Mucilaginibacter sp. 21P]|uniref:hypothetical protein n=1 Tax=Mucilaginibacter sp. 21P TaxID=2778902 RepID=UPI001C5848E2|nr:hypothetical protein [Mucilaginibacter sp. 21P]QXV66455.1 hypothetical protein INP83_05060 [Mucilaginibacter sp. 21P]